MARAIANQRDPYTRRNLLTRAREAFELALTPAVESQYPVGEVIARRKLGDGAERGGLARIPFTRIEADRIASLVPARGVLKATGFSANLRAVTDGSLEHYRIVHFATHGVLNTRTPDLSGLVFSLVDARGRPQEGFLRLHDLDRLR